jgi:hypothetical protein
MRESLIQNLLQNKRFYEMLLMMIILLRYSIDDERDDENLGESEKLSVLLL